MATTTDTTQEHSDRAAKLERKRKRAKLRRKAKKMDIALRELHKPLPEWDEEELARGRPRAIDGTFRGKAPEWVNSQVVEEAVKRFTDYSSSRMRSLTTQALDLAEQVLQDQSTDKRGRPVVPVSVKWDAAKWLLEQLHGKPTARVEMDLSVRLQAMLGIAMVNPDGETAIDVPSWEEAVDEAEEEEDEE